jgi:SAM-dependent methyltransferase
MQLALVWIPYRKPRRRKMTAVTDEIRSYWNLDASTYDNAPGHRPRTAFELATWSAALARLLPLPPARVLDVGAGTGFLSILIAKQGYEVTAMDLSPGMLERLRDNARRAGVEVETREGDACDPPLESFDAVVERHVLWTMPEPPAALEAWRRAAPSGRLLLIETLWGPSAGPGEHLRHAVRSSLRRLRREHPDHHAEYESTVRDQLPLGDGTPPETLVSLVESSSWGVARVERLRDVEWATRCALRSAVDRLVGVSPRFVVIGG